MGFTAKARVTGTPSQITSFPNGSQLNPSLTFQGAQNSGLYHSGNGNVALSVNGTQQVHVHAGGLDVNGTLTGNGALLTGIITNNASLLTEGIIANERLPSTLGNSSTVYQGNGSSLTGIITNNASLLTAGTLSQAVLPPTVGNASTIYQGNGSLLTGIITNNASVLTVGTLSQAVFPTTLGNASTILVGNGSQLTQLNAAQLKGIIPEALLEAGDTSVVSLYSIQRQVDGVYGPYNTKRPGLPLFPSNCKIIEQAGSVGNTIVTHTVATDGNVFYYTSPSNIFTANLIVPTTSTFQQVCLILDQDRIPYLPGNFIVNGQAPENMTSMFYSAGTESVVADVRTVGRNGQMSGTPYGIDVMYLTIQKLSSSWRLFARLGGMESIRSVFDNPTSYSWDTSSYTSQSSETVQFTVPFGVTSLSAVCIGGGGGGYYYYRITYSPSPYPHDMMYSGGGNGGHLRYAINIPVTPFEVLTITKGGAGGASVGSYGSGATQAGGESSIKRGNTAILTAAGGGVQQGAQNGNSSTISAFIGGGNGGLAGTSISNYSSTNVNTTNNFGSGGGGAGGYAGNGGNGSYTYSSSSTGSTAATGSYAGGGGGARQRGGGVGSRGATSNPQGAGGSGRYYTGSAWVEEIPAGQGGAGSVAYGYGGGGDPSSQSYSQQTSNYGSYQRYLIGSYQYGGPGHVRLVWNDAGTSRAYPSTNVLS